jgi:hypothetical protein
MNRRTALLLTTLLGSFLPSSLLGQETKRRNSRTRSREDRGFQPASSSSDSAEATRAEFEDEPASEEPPPVFSNEPGFQWRRFSIGRYTRSAQNQPNPQKAIIDWIFRRTNPNDWHGEKTAVLTASKTELRAYNSPQILKQVEEVVERFTGATEDVLSIHVQFIAAVDTRWRHTVFSRLTSVGSGPQGQQIWMMRVEDAALVLSQMQIQQGFRKLADQRVDMINGQTLTIKTSEPRTFSGGIQRESAAGTGFQPKADKLEESIVLRLSPLLLFEGDGVDAAIDLTVNSVQSFQRTKIIAPREIGPSEMTIDVPISYQTHLDQTVKNWPLGQTLLISGGIHPGIIDKKGGWLGTPLGAPSSTEVLIFLDAETVTRSKSRARNTDVTAARGTDSDDEEEPPVTRSKARKPTRRAARGPDLDAEAEEN